MSNVLKQYGPLVGRVLLAVMFLLAGINKIGGFAATSGWMASKGLPMTDVLLVLTIIIEIGGAVMIMVGWKASIGAAALLLFTIVASYVFHDFWNLTDTQAIQTQMIMLMKNLSIVGGLLIVMAFGTGPYSVEKS
ncbi:MAG: DoxX family protein [Acidiferrobacterales bacterium]